MVVHLAVVLGTTYWNLYVFLLGYGNRTDAESIELVTNSTDGNSGDMLPESAMANTIPGVDPLVAEAGSPLLPLALLFTSTTPSPAAAPEVSSIQPVSNQISEMPTTSPPKIRGPEALLIAHAEEHPAHPQVVESAEEDTPPTTVAPSTSTALPDVLPDGLPDVLPDGLPSTSTPEETSSAPMPSLADQQANLLQFLVSNPPAWVIDEIINGSSMTTWYPLPISRTYPSASTI